MMRSSLFLLDTDISSYLIKRRHPSVQDRFHQVPTANLHLSAISVTELLFGLQQLPVEHPLHERTSSFIRNIRVLPWDIRAAQFHATLKYQLGRRGEPIGEMDLMIAAHAMAIGATLVTNNTKHFGRLAPELVIENWAAA